MFLCYWSWAKCPKQGSFTCKSLCTVQCLRNWHHCQVKWWDPNWDYGSKPLLILELRFQICSFVLLCHEVQWLIGLKTLFMDFFPPSRAGRGVRRVHSWCSSRCFESNCCMPESLEITNYFRNYRTSNRQLWYWSRKDWNRFLYVCDWQGSVVLEADSVWDPRLMAFMIGNLWWSLLFRCFLPLFF